MATPTIYSKWLIERFGSMTAYDAEIVRHETPWAEEARLEREWALAVCEEAGIPYSEWTANVLVCARERMVERESEISTVRSLNDLHNQKPMSALDHWLRKLAGFPSAYA